MSLATRIAQLERHAASGASTESYDVRLWLHHPFYLIATSPYVRVLDGNGHVVAEGNGVKDARLRDALLRGRRVVYFARGTELEIGRDVPFPRLLAGLLWLHRLNADLDPTATAESAAAWRPLPAADDEVKQLLRDYCDRSFMQGDRPHERVHPPIGGEPDQEEDTSGERG